MSKSWEFLVFLAETTDLLTSLDVKYSGAHLVMHLKTRTAKRKQSCCLIGSQRKPFSKGVMWSNFLAPHKMRQAKFCTAWSLSRLAWVVLLQTEEQQNNLLNTRAFIIIIKARLSKICLTRLIWPKRDMHEDTVETICSLYVKLESSVTPRSLAALTGSSSFPNDRQSLKTRVTKNVHESPKGDTKKEKKERKKVRTSSKSTVHHFLFHKILIQRITEAKSQFRYTMNCFQFHPWLPHSSQLTYVLFDCHKSWSLTITHGDTSFFSVYMVLMTLHMTTWQH